MTLCAKWLWTLIPVALAPAASPDEVKRIRQENLTQVLEDVEVMGRVLESELGKGKDGEVRSFALAHFYGDVAADKSLLGRTGTSVHCADYLPGIGAVFNLSVSVKTVEVKVEEESKEEPSESKKKSLWEEKQEEVRGARTGHFVKDYSAAREWVVKYAEPMELRFDDESLEKLEDTLLSTLRDYGRRMHLEDDEQVILSIRLAPAGAADSAQRLFFVANGAADPPRAETSDAVWAPFGGRLMPSTPRRLVMMVRMSTLNKLVDGGLSKEELRARTSIQYL